RHHRQARLFQPVEERRGRWGQREVTAIRRSAKRTRRADEGTRDDATNTHAQSGEFVSNSAPAIELGYRNDILVCRNLEDAVRGRIDNRLARIQVLGAKLLDD